ncbi:NADP-dependent oxidoreductase [Catenuloplanes atrovinosus]|uniref:NADPH:quinone reductase-like Zn-dependent oxidoreductase n=1 Tax=Catenuloplanes atrovinosus TaxID=137266 RepID=A0AAE3YNY1_9ACTN|nr:NADP-dependent oxidoreductase [Catenuloplanes atrovinosus]MDR7277279.1 NADPH:quinone reductase-like Zn-dependent oxidoreductase [Catenuloplanes atrovinosus]
MKAVRFRRYGGPEVLEITDVPRPRPGDGQVLIEVVTAALNPGEIGIREGLFATMWPATFPEGQGNDFSGVVAEVGAGVTGLVAGQPVIGFAPRAAQAEFVAAGVSTVAVLPSGIGWDAAATIAGVGATAWASVEAVAPRPGETVVVSAAAGGVGSYAAQLAALHGARVIGTASEGNHEFLASLGIVPVRYGPGLEARLRQAAPEGVHALIDTFGAGNVDAAIALGVSPSRINTIADGRAVHRYGVHHQAQEQADDPRIWSRLAGLIAEGRLTVPITRAYPLHEVRQAYRDLGTRHVRGKRVLHVAPASRRQRLGETVS